MAVREIVDTFAVSRNSVVRYVAKHRQGRSLEPSVPPGAEPKLGVQEYDWLRAEIKSNPYRTSYELTAKFNREFRSNRVHRSTILRAMHKLGYTYKKRPRSRLNVNGKMSDNPAKNSSATRTRSQHKT